MIIFQDMYSYKNQLESQGTGSKTIFIQDMGNNLLVIDNKLLSFKLKR